MEDVFETWDGLVGHLRAQNGRDVEFSLDSFDRVALAGHRDLLADSSSDVKHYVIPLKDGNCIRISEHIHYYLAKWENSGVSAPA